MSETHDTTRADSGAAENSSVGMFGQATRMRARFGVADGRVAIIYDIGRFATASADAVGRWIDRVTIHALDPALDGTTGQFFALYDVAVEAAYDHSIGEGDGILRANVGLALELAPEDPSAPKSSSGRYLASSYRWQESAPYCDGGGECFPGVSRRELVPFTSGRYRLNDPLTFVFGEPFALKQTISLNAQGEQDIGEVVSRISVVTDASRGVTWGGFDGGVFDSAGNPIEFRVESETGIDWSNPALVPWDTAGGGSDYNNDANWVFGESPEPDQSVLLNRDATYSINNINAVNRRLVARAGDVTLNAMAYRLTDTSSDDPSLVVGEVAGNSPKLTLASGLLESASATIAEDAGSAGQFWAAGGATSFRYGGELVVASAGNGQLRIENGARLEGVDLTPPPAGGQAGGLPEMISTVISALPGSHGALTITGTDSRWFQPFGEVVVADAGEATLNILERGKAQLLTIFAAKDTTSHATIAIDGAGSELQYLGRLSLGQKGHAEMSLRSGGKLEDGEGADVFLGELSGGEGRAVVTGSGAEWNGRGSTVQVGREGRGTVDVTAGANLNLKEVQLGSLPAGVGLFNVAGAGTTARLAGLSVGQFGRGTVTVREGASLTTEVLVIGDLFRSVGSMTVEGAGSKFTELQTDAVVGARGYGSLTIRDNADVLLQPAFQPGMSIGKFAEGEGSVVVANGGNLEGEITLVVGVAGKGDLELSAGGTAKVRVLQIGAADARGFGRVKVEGVGSLLHATQPAELTGFLTPNIIGGKGTGQLYVLVGGQVRLDNNLAIGAEVGGRGVVHVSGGSLMTVTSDDPPEIIGNFVGGAGTGELGVFLGSTFGLSGSMTVGGKDDAHGSMIVRNPGSTANISGTLYIGRAGDVDARGTLLVGDGGYLNAPQIRITPRGLLTGDGGVIEGTVINNGTVSPGNSPGTLTIDGDYEQMPGGVLELEIGGTLATQHDELHVSGNAMLGGSMDLKFIDNFAPQQGQQFELLTVDGTTDLSTTTFEIHNLAPGFLFDVTPSAGGIVMTALNDGVFVPSIDGDFNDDGAVDAADYVVWRKTGGTQQDYNTWRTNFDGTAAGATAGLPSSAPVPEPDAFHLVVMTLFATAASAFKIQRRRPRKRR